MLHTCPQPPAGRRLFIPGDAVYARTLERHARRDQHRQRVRRAAPMIGIGIGLEFAHGTGFNGDFRSLLSTAEKAANLQYMQADLGLTHGGTLLLVGTSPAITLTGPAASACGYVVQCLGTGALGVATMRYSYDFDTLGGAANWTNFTAAATVPLVGLASGETLNMAAGTYNSGDSWRTVGAVNADQSGNGKDYTQVALGAQPIVTAKGTRPTLLFDGVNDFYTSSLNLPLPGTTATEWVGVFRQVTFIVNSRVIGPATGGISIFANPSSPSWREYNGTSCPANNGAAVGSFVFANALWNNSTTDFLRLGSTIITGTNAGNTFSSTSRQIAAENGASFGNIEMMLSMYFNAPLVQATRDRLAAGAVQYWGSIVGT